jgi:hypothetical protein
MRYQKPPEVDEILMRLLAVYRKKCLSFGTTPNGAIKNWFEDGIELEKLELVQNG